MEPGVESSPSRYQANSLSPQMSCRRSWMRGPVNLCEDLASLTSNGRSDGRAGGQARDFWLSRSGSRGIVASSSAVVQVVLPALGRWKGQGTQRAFRNLLGDVEALSELWKSSGQGQGLADPDARAVEKPRASGRCAAESSFAGDSWRPAVRSAWISE